MEIRLSEIIIPTRVARAGHTVGDVFEYCVAHNVPGVPFCNASDEVVGKVSIRHTLKQTCIPDYVVHGAHLLGDLDQAVKIPDALAREVLKMPAERFLLEHAAIIKSTASVIKALAMMEKYDSGYAFAIDGTVYKGIVTRMGIASLLLKAREG